MPRKAPEQPSALDLLDPAPREQRPPAPRPPRRRAGDAERAVRRDLALLPDELRKGGIAAGALKLAMDLDTLMVTGRDRAAHVREIRQCLITLREQAPGDRKGDKTDDLQAKREARLEAAGG
jgi:hypothetical protein